MVRSRLAALGGLALSFAPVQAQPGPVVVEVWSFGFAPEPIRLLAGTPVTMTFVNRSGASHDFTAPGFFQHATIIGGSVAAGEIDLKPHETKSITLVPRAGTYHAHCSHFLHKQMGMDALIVVS